MRVKISEIIIRLSDPIFPKYESGYGLQKHRTFIMVKVRCIKAAVL
jgi:hypothetical protein